MSSPSRGTNEKAADGGLAGWWHGMAWHGHDGKMDDLWEFACDTIALERLKPRHIIGDDIHNTWPGDNST